MVVIPARNEEAVIGRAVKSLPPDSVLVVDDASNDRTAEVARSAGAGVLPAPKLGRGANGKSNACAEGARVMTTRWILFADADTWYEPGFLESVVAAAEKYQLDFFSVYLWPEWRTWRERTLSPNALALFFFGTNPRKSPADSFNGQCVLVRREAYEFVGGHGTIITELCDDVKLAALASRHRMKVAVMRSGTLGHVELRTEGLARRMNRFTQVSPRIAIRVFLAATVLALWAPVTAWVAVQGDWSALALLIFWPFGLGWSQGLVTMLLAPLGFYPLLLSGIHAGLRVLTGRPVEWKGRMIR